MEWGKFADWMPTEREWFRRREQRLAVLDAGKAGRRRIRMFRARELHRPLLNVFRRGGIQPMNP